MEAKKIPTTEGYGPLTEAEVDRLFEEPVNGDNKRKNRIVDAARRGLKIVDTLGKETFDDTSIDEGPSQAIKEVAYAEQQEQKRKSIFLDNINRIFAEGRVIGHLANGHDIQVTRTIDSGGKGEYEVQIITAPRAKKGKVIRGETKKIAISEAMKLYPQLLNEFLEDFLPGTSIIVHDPLTQETKDATFGRLTPDGVDILLDKEHKTISLSEFIKMQPVLAKDHLRPSDEKWKRVYD